MISEEEAGARAVKVARLIRVLRAAGIRRAEGAGPKQVDLALRVLGYRDASPTTREWLHAALAAIDNDVKMAAAAARQRRRTR